MYYISNIVFFIIYDRLYMYIYHEFHIPPGLRVFFVEGDGSLALPSSSFGTAPWRPFWGFMKYWNVRIRADKYIYIYKYIKLINNIHIYISFKYIYIHYLQVHMFFVYYILYILYTFVDTLWDWQNDGWVLVLFIGCAHLWNHHCIRTGKTRRQLPCKTWVPGAIT